MIKLKSLLENHDREEFLRHHRTGFIPSDAYDRYESSGGLSWLGNKSKYPKVLGHGKFGPYEVEFRGETELAKYVKHDENDDIMRLPNGDLVWMSPEEIKAENLPLVETTVVAFVDDKPIGHASNEFGAVGVFVEKAYQGFGIGTTLLELHVELRPNLKSGRGRFGQMTHAGERLTMKYYDKMAQKHGKDWFKKLRSQLTETDIPVTDIPDRLYHATVEPLVNSIIRSGLIPGGTGLRPFEWSDKGYVYLAKSPIDARNILESSTNPKIKRMLDKINVLTISTSGLNRKRFFVDDESFIVALKIISIKYKGQIPPQNIINYGD